MKIEPDDGGEQPSFRTLSLWPPKSLEPDGPRFSTIQIPVPCTEERVRGGEGGEVFHEPVWPTAHLLPSQREGPPGLLREETTAGTKSRNTPSTKHRRGAGCGGEALTLRPGALYQPTSANETEDTSLRLEIHCGIEA